MSNEIKVVVGELKLEGKLNDTSCAKSVYNMLPLEREFETWGDEFYFPVELDMELDETARSKVEVGTIGYWPPGKAVAIFFGPTPGSDGDEPVAASDVNIIGKLKNSKELKKVKDADKILIEKY
mgnify:CR=1 FL=1